jgi:hypothetical protein
MINQLIPALLLIPGFWMGWKFLPPLAGWLQQFPNRPIQLSPTHKIILWLTVGSLFSGTWIGLYGLLYPLVLMFLDPGWCNTQPHFMTIFGNIPGCLYILPSRLFFLIVFGVVFWFGFSFITDETTKKNKFYVVILLLTITNLIFQLLDAVFSNLIYG